MSFPVHQFFTYNPQPASWKQHTVLHGISRKAHEGPPIWESVQSLMRPCAGKSVGLLPVALAIGNLWKSPLGVLIISGNMAYQQIHAYPMRLVIFTGPHRAIHDNPLDLDGFSYIRRNHLVELSDWEHLSVLAICNQCWTWCRKTSVESRISKPTIETSV